MKTEYLLNLPYPPSVNAYYGIICSGGIPHKYVRDKGKNYQKEVNQYIKDNNYDIQANIPLKVTMYITPPSLGKHDIDNILKALFDSLTLAKFWEDDSFVRDLHISYNPARKPGSILMHVTML